MTTVLEDKRKDYETKEQLRKLSLDFHRSYITDIAVFLVPAIPAIITLLSIVEKYPTLFNIHISVAWISGLITAAGIEFLAFSTTELYAQMKQYNRTKLKTDEAAPENVGLWLVISYMLITLFLVTVLKIMPELAQYSVYSLTLLGGVVATLTVIQTKFRGMQRIQYVKQEERKTSNESRTTNTELLNIVDKQKEEILKLQNEMLTVQQKNVEPNVQVLKPKNVKNGTKLNVQQRQEQLLNIIAQQYNNVEVNMLNKSAISTQLNCSQPTVTRDLQVLCSDNKISLGTHVKVFN